MMILGISLTQAQVAIRQVASAATPANACTFNWLVDNNLYPPNYSIVSAGCAALPAPLTVNLSPAAKDSALLLVGSGWGSLSSCTDNLGQQWPTAQAFEIGPTGPVVEARMPPQGATVEGISSVTCGLNFEPMSQAANIPGATGAEGEQIIQLFEVSGAGGSEAQVSLQNLWCTNGICSVAAPANGLAILGWSDIDDYSGYKWNSVSLLSGTIASSNTVSEVWSYCYSFTNPNTGPAPYCQRYTYLDGLKTATATTGNAGFNIPLPFSIAFVAKFTAPSTYIQAKWLTSDNLEPLIATSDPASKTAHVPLGSAFSLALGNKSADGSFTPISSTYSFTAQATVPPVTLPSLFSDSVVLQYASSSDQEIVLQAVHKGTATLHIVPEDTSLDPIDVTISVEDPGSLGGSHPEVDSIIYSYANDTGIPPQYIKAQMAQESGSKFDPNAYRYEPFSKDDLEVSRGQDLRIVNPYAFYRFATLADSQDGALPQGAQLSAADIAPRSVFQICATEACTSLVNIPPDAQFVSALQIVNMNDWFWHWTSCSQCVDRTVELYNDDFTAQTAIAASYGYMQVAFETAIAPMQWPGVNGNRNPSYLFDTPENMAAGGGSLNLGTSYLQRLCWRSGDGNFSPDNSAVSWQDESDMRSAFQVPWSQYNGGNAGYAAEVSQKVQRYLPTSATEIFGVSQ